MTNDFTFCYVWQPFSGFFLLKLIIFVFYCWAFFLFKPSLLKLIHSIFSSNLSCPFLSSRWTKVVNSGMVVGEMDPDTNMYTKHCSWLNVECLSQCYHYYCIMCVKLTSLWLSFSSVKCSLIIIPTS